jgi:O-antigen/teichoic acid export membrane protein
MARWCERMRDGSVSRGVSITLIGNVFPPLAGLITAPLLATSLGVEMRGEAAAAVAPLLLATSIGSLGLPEALTYWFANGIGDRRKALRHATLALFATGIVGTVVLALVALPLAAGSVELGRLITIAGLALTASLLQAGLRGVAAGMQLWWVISIDRIAGATARLVSVVILVWSDQLSLLTATLALALSPLVGVIPLLAMLISHRRADSGEVPAPQNFFAYGSRVWLGSLSGILLLRLDQTLIVPLSGPRELGIYAVAVTVSEIALVFNSSVANVMFSMESRRQSGERLSQAARVSSGITIVIAAVVALSAGALIPLFFGVEFADAVPVTAILLLAIVVGNPGSVAGSGLSARGRPGLRSVSLIAALTANVVALIGLVPHYGAIGAAVATLVGNAIAGWLNVAFLRTHFGFAPSDFIGWRRSDSLAIARLLRRRS